MSVSVGSTTPSPSTFALLESTVEEPVKKADKLNEIVNSFGSTSIFCEIALQRIQLASAFRARANNELEAIKTLESQTNALSSLEQFAREGKSFKVSAPSSREQYKESLDKIRPLLQNYIEQYANIKHEQKLQEADKFIDKMALYVQKNNNPLNFNLDAIKLQLRMQNAYVLALGSFPVSKEFANLIKDLGVDVEVHTSLKYSHFIGLPTNTYKLEQPRFDYDALDDLQHKLSHEANIKLNAHFLINSGFSEVPSFEDNDKGRAQKEKFLTKIDMKKDELSRSMNSTMAYLQDYIGQTQSNMQKANKSLEKYDELLAQVVGKKK